MNPACFFTAKHVGFEPLFKQKRQQNLSRCVSNLHRLKNVKWRQLHFEILRLIYFELLILKLSSEKIILKSENNVVLK